MATIRKRGTSYQIRVSCGYKADGKQITKTMTYKPPSDMTERQIRKEVERQAVLFEEKCKSGIFLDGSIKLADFAEKWLCDYAEKQLKAKTVMRYKQLLSRIVASLGHIRLDRLQPHHLLEFYKELGESEKRCDTHYVLCVDLRQKLKLLGLTQAQLASLSGLSVRTIQACASGKNVTKQTADKISATLAEKGLFSPACTGASLSPKTIQYHHILLSSMLSTAVEWQIIPSNPCTRVKPPRAVHCEAKFLDELQTAELIACLGDVPLQYKTMVMLFLYTGMRRGELCGLNWDDIDFSHNLVSISKANLYLPGIGIYEDSTKNKSSQRVIKIPTAMTSLLREHQREQIKKRLALGEGWHNSGKVFTACNGKPVHPDTLTKWFRNFVKKNGLPDVHIHSLRHTNASLLIAAGTNIRTVSNRLGHAATSTTSNIYAHAIRSADELAAEALADFLNPIKKSENA